MGQRGADPNLKAGRLASTALLEASNGVVVSVFRSAANLLLDTGRLVALLAFWRPLHPWAISGTGLSENVCNGMPARVRNGILSLGGIELHLNEVQIQDLSLTGGIPSVSDETFRSLRDVAFVSDQDDSLSQVALSCLEQSRQTGDITLIARALGMGGGLTPSGDDILVGLLTAFELMCDETYGGSSSELPKRRGSPCQLRKTLVSALPESLDKHTTLLSAQMIEAAIIGCYPEPLVKLASALADFKGGIRIERAAKEVVHIGHDSGRAMLCGFTLGIEFSQIGRSGKEDSLEGR